jgi:hypothetical protein
MMMHWFAPEAAATSGGTELPRCETPTGEPCERCHRLIAEDDRGFVQFEGPRAVYHRICFLKSVTDHKFWPRHGLVPDSSDGFEPTGNGSDVECPTCHMVYSYELETWLT